VASCAFPQRKIVFDRHEETKKYLPISVIWFIVH
jgi:hypothetical protein